MKRVIRVARILTVHLYTSTKMRRRVTRCPATLMMMTRSALTAFMTFTAMARKLISKKSTETMNAKQITRSRCCQSTQWTWIDHWSTTQVWTATSKMQTVTTPIAVFPNDLRFSISYKGWNSRARLTQTSTIKRPRRVAQSNFLLIRCDVGSLAAWAMD